MPVDRALRELRWPHLELVHDVLDVGPQHLPAASHLGRGGRGNTGGRQLSAGEWRESRACLDGCGATWQQKHGSKRGYLFSMLYCSAKHALMLHLLLEREVVSRVVRQHHLYRPRMWP